MVAAEHKLAGLSQRQLADRANYSLAMVKAVEPALRLHACRTCCGNSPEKIAPPRAGHHW